MQVEIKPSERYRIDTIYVLRQLAELHIPKSFYEMTRQDIIDYLDKIRKPEQVDPKHKCIGTYGLTRIILLRFLDGYTTQTLLLHPKDQNQIYAEYTQDKAS